MIAVDASVLVNALTMQGPAAERIAREELHAPFLLDVEVTQTLRSLRRGGFGALRTDAALEALLDFQIVRHPHTPLLRRAWQLRDSLSASDAVYVALAEGLGVPLVTADARIAGCPGLRTTVEVLPAG